MGSLTMDKVRADLARMIEAPAPVTALICGNNRITVLALHALASLDVPLAMIGFDDLELADLLRVTVVAQDAAELGRRAAGLLFSRMDGDPAPPRRIVVPTRLVERGSGELVPRTPGRPLV
jgi:LacI family transcriptional regulator